MKHGISISRAIAAGFFTSVCFSSAALAVTTTVAFQVRATIAAECKLVSGDFIDFGEHGVIDANIDKMVVSQFNAQPGRHIPLALASGPVPPLRQRPGK